jgi:hypothetical protein
MSAGVGAHGLRMYLGVHFGDSRGMDGAEGRELRPNQPANGRNRFGGSIDWVLKL